MNNPSKTSYRWVSWIQKIPFFYLLLGLFFFYLSINVVFSIVYYQIKTLETSATFLDYVYFSFVTALTIGYGDFHPLTSFGKVLVIIQSCTTALYFAVMIATLSANMFFPKNTIHYSNNFLYDKKTGFFGIRIINLHNERLVNPEIRITVTEHCCGNVMASHRKVAKIDSLPYLGKHDETISFQDMSQVTARPSTISIYNQIQQAMSGKNCKPEESRFRITISITGNYGIQQIVSYKKYYANECKLGECFKPIEYTDEDQNKWGINYTKFPNFWSDFNKII